MSTGVDRPRAGAKSVKAKATVGGTGRKPPLSSSRALRAILDELAAARATLDAATAALRAVDARVRSWDRSEAFLDRRALALHDEATTAFAEALDGLHALLVRLADRGDRTLGQAFSSRLRAAGTRRLQARVHRELRALQRAFEGGGALLARTLMALDA
ncbi:MAG TPA: hypothetical protein VGK52_18160 [Polyangia bacterium]